MLSDSDCCGFASLLLAVELLQRFHVGLCAVRGALAHCLVVEARGQFVAGGARRGRFLSLAAPAEPKADPVEAAHLSDREPRVVIPRRWLLSLHPPCRGDPPVHRALSRVLARRTHHIIHRPRREASPLFLPGEVALLRSSSVLGSKAIWPSATRSEVVESVVHIGWRRVDTLHLGVAALSHPKRGPTRRQAARESILAPFLAVLGSCPALRLVL